MADQGNSSLTDTSITDANLTAIETTTMPPVMEMATVTEAATEMPATMNTRIPALAPTAEVTDARRSNPVSSTTGIIPDTLQISEEPARAPVANFNANTTSGVVPMFVRFTDTSTNTPASWLWDFGDSGTSTVRNATHTYRVAGTYSVNLTVTNSAGSHSEVKTGYITVSPDSEGGQANTAWPKFGYDSRNTGQSPYTGPQSNSTLWVKTGTLVYSYSTPVLGSDNSIYLASISSIRKLDSDGNLLWVNSSLQTINTPALGSDGTIYAGTLSGGVYAINPDGSIQWNYPTGGINSYGGSPAIGSDGTIYIGSTDKILYALNPNGTLKWQNSTPAPISSGPAIGSDGTVYVVSGTDPYAFNPDGTVKWISSAFMSVGSGGRGYSSPVIGPDGTIYITVYQGTNLSALNPDGSLKWSYTLGGSYGYGSPAVASDGTIYLAHYGDGTIYALNPDGTRKWSYATGKTGLKVYSSPVIGADGIVYVGFSDNKVYALNPDGTLKWTYTTGGQIRNSPAIGRDGTLYVGSCDGYLYAFAGSVSFTADPTSGPKPLTVRFTDMSSNSPTGWVWEFGDGSTSAEQNPVHTYIAAGTYTVNLTVTHPKGTSSLARSGFIRVTSVPVAGFTANETTGTVPFTVRFTDTSTNSPASWAWEFGDDSTSTEQNPVHTYTAPGTYTVNLTASNADGSTTNVKEKYIGVFIPPVANFTTNATSGVIPLVVQFVDTSANAPTAWFWDFGDGTNSTEQNPVHRYPTAGTYSVNLTVSNFAGSDDEEKTGFMTAQETVPVARFSGAPTSGTAPLTVTFTDASGGVITGYRWSFGDGTTSTLASPTHQYTVAGNYLVNLTVTGPGGSDSEEKPGYISVYSEPIANFTSDVTSGSAPLTVRFMDTSAGNPTSWLWDFGDGSTSTDQNPTHTFTTTTTDTITFTVSLTATNYLGNNTLAKPDTITLSSSPPGISFTGSPRVSTAVPLTVRFNDTSTLSPVSWYWEFGDGGTSTEQNPIHTYTATGSYTVNLTATNIIGTSTSSKPQFINVLTQQPIAAQNCVNLYVSNDEGVKYDIPNGVRAEGSYNYVPNTYYFASRGGLNALSISDGTYFSTITRTTNQSGTFWLDFGGGQPTMHDGILMLAVNGTIPDDFYVHIRTSGDNWTLLSGPAVGNNDAPTEYHYIEGAVDQTFTKEDFIYGPQIWRPCSKADYPIYNGQNMSDADNTFQIMFIDTRVGACGDRIKIEYSFYNLTTFASFDCYGWYIASNHGTGIIMTNSASSGYMVTGIPGVPVANFTSITESNDYLSPVWFTDTSANVPQAWYWDFGDGNTSTEQNPTHTYSTPGTFAVNLTVTNLKGTNSIEKTLTKIVPEPPVANFTESATSGMSPLGIQFTDRSTGTITSWLWDFGDGTISIERNPLHWYKSGTFSVNLTVTNSGGSSSLVKSSLITVSPTTAENRFRNPGFETGTLDNWTAGSGISISSTPQYRHTGMYSVQFPGTDSFIEQYIDLTDVRSLSFWECYAPDSFAYASSFSVVIDGTTVATINPPSTSLTQHTIPVSGYSGVHQVRVSYSHSFGSYIGYLDDFLAPPVSTGGIIPTFLATPTYGIAPLTVNFTDASTGNATTWAWDFENDGTIDAATRNATFTYSSAGTYTVNLTESNAEGTNTSIRTGYITVYPAGSVGTLPGYTNISVRCANDAGIRYDAAGNGTYYINGNGGGLNAVHISTDLTVSSGQVTVSPNQSGTFYVTDTGGRGYQDEVVLLLAINGTLPDDFSTRIRTSGYSWMPSTAAPASGAYTYQVTALDETFTKSDFIYGPQSWKPQGSDAIYPILFREDLNDSVNQFQLAFIDTRAGLLGTNHVDFASLTDKGAVKVEYSFTNLSGYAAFNLYAWNNATTQGQGMGWTNRVSGDGSSGYSVIPSPGLKPPVANFTANATSGDAPLTIAFTDTSTNVPISWLWDFGDGTNSTVQNATHMYQSMGIYTINLTVTNTAGTNTLSKAGYITVTDNPADRPVLSLPEVSLYQNTRTLVPVEVCNLTGATRFSFNLTYDPSIIQIHGITLNESYANGTTLDVNATTGIVRISLSDMDGLTIGSSVPVLFINLIGTGSVGSASTLLAENAEWSDGVFTNRLFTVYNGTTIIETVRGDFNKNGFVDIGDVARTAYMLVGKTPVDIAADFNDNGKVDVGDATKIAYYLIGRVTEM